MSLVQRSLIKSESQPVLIKAGTAGGTQIQFPDNQYIRNKKLMAINLYTNLNEFLTPAPPPAQTYVDGKLILSYLQATFIYITLESYAGVQFVRKKPINDFNNYMKQSNGNWQANNFIGQKVNWPKSYIEIANGLPAGLFPTDVYALFDIHFTELSEETVRKQLAPTFGKRK